MLEAKASAPSPEIDQLQATDAKDYAGLVAEGLAKIDCASQLDDVKASTEPAFEATSELVVDEQTYTYT